MRRTALIVVPLSALALIAGCIPQSTDARPCPLGEWQASGSRMVNAMGWGGPNVQSTGSVVFQFAEDGTFDWRWDQTISNSGEGQTVAFTFDATMRGEWSGNPDNLTLNVTDGTGTVAETGGSRPETTDIRDSFDIDDGLLATCSGSDMYVRLNNAVVVLLKRK
ncbi:MAG: hypothetical protein FWD11_03490 [Micrococcales bacterium]|nr:hypothetical protein [Micrococcales bacterium]